MTERAEVIVVGAGIVGAACAERLAGAGLDVLLLDRGAPSGGATSEGMGHVLVLDDAPAELALSALSRRLWDDRAARLPAGVERRVTGTLWVAEDEEQMSVAERRRSRLAEHGVACRVLDSRELAAREAALRDGLAGALLVTEDSVIYPPAAVVALLDAARAAGARTRFGDAVSRVGRGEVELESGVVLEAGRVVVAAGLAGPSLLEGIDLGAFVRPKKGHLAITDRHPGFCRHQILELGYLDSAHGSEEVSVAFNVQPRATGQVLVGSSRQIGVSDREVEPAVAARMLRRAVAFMPALAELPVLRVWTGLRPATPDALPLIGALPDDPRTLLACGHEGLGITTATGTAELILAEILGATPPIDARPFRPLRFLEEAGRV